MDVKYDALLSKLREKEKSSGSETVIVIGNLWEPIEGPTPGFTDDFTDDFT